MEPLALASSSLSLVPALFCALAVGAITPSRASAQTGIGVFDQQSDIGAVSVGGTGTYQEDVQQYTLASSGTNMWTDHDEFHFVWKKVTGDFILQASARFLNAGGDPHRKLGLIVRASLDSHSAHVNACRHGGGLAALQFRRTQGATTEEIHLPISGPDVLQLERIGGKFRVSAAHFGETFVSQDFDGVTLPDEVYVGIYVCAHNNAVVERALFSNVRLIKPAAQDFRPYRDYIGSDIEVLDISSGLRRTIHRAEDSLQAPNWTPDSRRLVFNHNGKMFSLELASGKVTPIDTGEEIHCNNDHSLSFDGKFLGISSGTTSRVFTLPIAGGTPHLVTPVGPSYLHGWSPDGKYLLFTGSRNGEYDIYRVPVEGGPEERLTTAKGLDDGSEYTPDGSTIFFNSERSGKMQVWKMNADGSGQTQVTFDEYNNWFPHVSPDGRTVVFLSYPADIKSDDHPFYKHVYLRRVPVSGGTPTVVGYLYGGQGSMNVNSWSPDSSQIAFVSNSGSF